MRGVQDEQGYNQVWSDGLATRIRAERRCDLLIGEMDVAPSRRVLEIGCGQGEIARRLAAKTGMQVVGLDRSERFVNEARANTSAENVRFELGDFTTTTLPGSPFDYIVGNGILHHLYFDLDASLRKIRRLLSSDGRIIFLEPNLHNPYVYLIFSYATLRRRAKLEPDEMAFTKSYIARRLRIAGFSDATIEYRDFLVPGTPDALIKPVVRAGDVAERVPALKHLSQSLLISARSSGTPA
jgi:ubiquinone/menaquinone biosynthesis C-methylase UbiE